MRLPSMVKIKQKFEDNSIRDTMKFAFTSMLHLCSRMTPDRKSRPWSSHWARNDYWLPPKFQEGNVWMLFENAFYGKQGVKKAKLDSNKAFEGKRVAASFEDLLKNGDILFSNESATELDCCQRGQ